MLFHVINGGGYGVQEFLSVKRGINYNDYNDLPPLALAKWMLARTTGDWKFLFPYFFFGIDIFIFFYLPWFLNYIILNPWLQKFAKNIYIKILINHLFI